MPTPCPKGRCPARADVYDWNTTEYRKGCRRTQCMDAHRLAEQRRRERKAAAAAVAAPPAQVAPDPADVDAVTVPSFDLVATVRADLEQLQADHPLKKSLGDLAIALASEVQFLIRAPSRSAAIPARQLVEILERLMPTKKGTLQDELDRLFADDDEDEPAEAR